MASLHERKGSFRLSFRYHGKQWFIPIGKVSRQEAEAKKSSADYLLMRLDQGLIQVPDGFDVDEFIRHDGKPPEKAVAILLPNSKKGPLTLGHLRDRYLDARSLGSEASTLYTSKIHFKHLVDTYGEATPIAGLRQDDLQRHVRLRAGKGISATTIKKEIATLRSAWRWALHADLIEIDCPNKGLVYPKEDELPPYQTMDEIQRRIEIGVSMRQPHRKCGIRSISGRMRSPNCWNTSARMPGIPGSIRWPAWPHIPGHADRN